MFPFYKYYLVKTFDGSLVFSFVAVHPSNILTISLLSLITSLRVFPTAHVATPFSTLKSLITSAA